MPTWAEYLALCASDEILQKEAQAMVQFGDVKTEDEWIERMAKMQYEMLKQAQQLPILA